MLYSRGHRGNKERLAWLGKQKLIRCDRCPRHRGENRVRQPRPDGYKAHRRHRRVADFGTWLAWIKGGLVGWELR